MMPFWQWKQKEYAKDQAAGTPRFKEDYYRAYGGYCNAVRRWPWLDIPRVPDRGKTNVG